VEARQSKQEQRREQQQQARPDTAQEPQTTRMRISAVKVTTKKGQKIEALSNEDEQEIKTEKVLLEPCAPTQKTLTKSKQYKE
jgi:hypothetical protein